MGGCYSKNIIRKVNSKVPDEAVPVKPFFRQSSQHDYDINDNVWIERKESNATEFKQIIEKETVLDKIIPGFEDNVYDFIDEGRMDVHTVNSLQISKFIPPPVNGRPLPLPPPSPKLSLAECRREASNNAIYSEYGDESGEVYNGESEDDIANVYDDHRKCQRDTYDLHPALPFAKNKSETSHSTNVKVVLKSIPNVRFFPKSERRPTAIAQSRQIGPIPPPPSKKDPVPRKSKQDLQREHDETKCAEFAAMVNIFKPMIVQNILVHDILPLLPFLDNHDDVYAELKQRSEKNAVVMLLNELERSKEIGKWNKFIDALVQCGYSYIVDNIRGYKFINRGYQLEYLKQLTPVIAKQISPRELMPYLMHYDLLGDTDRDYILCECNNRGEYAAALTLLDRITKKHRDWYRLFIKALEDAKYEEVAVNLRIENLMKSGRVKDSDGNYYEGYVHRDRETEAAPSSNGAPCIPPRIPIRNKRVVQLPPPPMLENDDGVYHQYQTTTRSMSSNVSDEIDLKEVFDDITFEQPNTQPKHTNPKFIQLEEEINELALKEKEINIEADLFQRKFSHCKNIVETKKKMRQLQIQIKEMEKEMAALNEAPDVGEENKDDDKYEEYNETDTLYQADIHKKLMLSIEHDEIFEKIRAKLPIFDLEFPEESSLLLPLPIFSPKFNKCRIQQLQSDSGSSLDEMLQENIYESCENDVLYR